MSSNVNIYAYTAASNPYFVKSLAHRYGYEFDKEQQLSSVLQQLVSYEGEAVLTEIIENNPDKELFMDYFEKKYGKKPDGCSCDASGATSNKGAMEAYMNFTGQMQAQAQQQVMENKMLTSQTTFMVILGAAMISGALIIGSIINKK
jgi:hypothetical protein